MAATNVYILQNQNDRYLDKGKNEWLEQHDTKHFYYAKHHDEALNTLIELNAKDPELRLRVLEVPLDDSKCPVVEDLE